MSLEGFGTVEFESEKFYFCDIKDVITRLEEKFRKLISNIEQLRKPMKGIL